MHVTFISSINEIDRDHWNRLTGIDYPFLRHEFLAALENSGSTTAETGWQPHHLIAFSQHMPIAVMPLFIKDHSYGEYVFDWSWADAYHRSQQNYYPKLLNAIPFTPSTGPRWGIDKSINKKDILPRLFTAIEAEAEKLALSSCHWLFTDTKQGSFFKQQGYLKRTGSQYHWFNKNYKNFDDFLATFTSRKRKNLSKERRRVAAQNIHLIVKEGAEITDGDWEHFYLFYHLTYFKRSGRQGYLTDKFFPILANLLHQHIIMVQAIKEKKIIAAALYFKDSQTLYGRYWGCKEEYDQLHFEACYYQGINYAIKNKLKRFDPGAQGEHKIQRGFTPTPTYSYHWIKNLQFREAINHFLIRESENIHLYIEEMKERLPFKIK